MLVVLDVAIVSIVQKAVPVEEVSDLAVGDPSSAWHRARGARDRLIR